MAEDKAIASDLQSVSLLYTVQIFVPLDRLGWNTIFQSLIRTYKKLQILGHTYYNGKIVIIHPEKEEDSNV